ncbi:unnamed protein product [Phaeothamnion confervicola]
MRQASQILLKGVPAGSHQNGLGRAALREPFQSSIMVVMMPHQEWLPKSVKKTVKLLCKVTVVAASASMISYAFKSSRVVFSEKATSPLLEPRPESIALAAAAGATATTDTGKHPLPPVEPPGQQQLAVAGGGGSGGSDEPLCNPATLRMPAWDSTKCMETVLDDMGPVKAAAPASAAWAADFCHMRYYFVGGFQCSGTGVLRHVLASHPLMRHHDRSKQEGEGQHIQTVFGWDGPRKNNPRGVCSCANLGCQYYCPKVQKDVMKNAADSRAKLWTQWYVAPPPHPDGTPTLMTDTGFAVEKSPDFFAAMRSRLFPHVATHLYTVRHPFCMRYYGDSHIRTLRAWLDTWRDLLAEQLPRLHGELYVVRFEDMLFDMAGIRRDVQQLLGLPDPSTAATAVAAAAAAGQLLLGADGGSDGVGNVMDEDSAVAAALAAEPRVLQWPAEQRAREQPGREAAMQSAMTGMAAGSRRRERRNRRRLARGDNSDGSDAGRSGSSGEGGGGSFTARSYFSYGEEYDGLESNGVIDDYFTDDDDFLVAWAEKAAAANGGGGRWASAGSNGSDGDVLQQQFRRRQREQQQESERVEQPEEQSHSDRQRRRKLHWHDEIHPETDSLEAIKKVVWGTRSCHPFGKCSRDRACLTLWNSSPLIKFFGYTLKDGDGYSGFGRPAAGVGQRPCRESGVWDKAQLAEAARLQWGTKRSPP